MDVAEIFLIHISIQHTALTNFNILKNTIIENKKFLAVDENPPMTWKKYEL